MSDFPNGTIKLVEDEFPAGSIRLVEDTTEMNFNVKDTGDFDKRVCMICGNEFIELPASKNQVCTFCKIHETRSL